MSPFYRQNDREAIGYLKASYYCLKKERDVKYFIIAISFLVCILGIFNRYLDVMFLRFYADIAAVQYELAKYINLTSGVVVILSCILSFYIHRKHVEGVVLQEYYDAYVFGFQRNLPMLRPISQTLIDIYASKVKSNDGRFMNFYFDSLEDVDEKTGHYDYLNVTFNSDHRLYMSVQSFFYFIWIGFCIIVFLLAISFDDKFINTLINILFPSLSAITVIAGSWFGFRQQVRQLNTALGYIDIVQRQPDRERTASMTDPLNLAKLQDAMYNYRSSQFVIPMFLVKHHKRQLAKENIGGAIKSSDLIIAASERTKIHLREEKAERTTVLRPEDTIKPVRSAPRSKTAPPLPKEEVQTLYLPKVSGEKAKRDDLSAKFKEYVPPMQLDEATQQKNRRTQSVAAAKDGVKPKSDNGKKADTAPKAGDSAPKANNKSKGNKAP